MIDLQALYQACQDFLEAADDCFDNDPVILGPSIQKLREALAE